MCAQTAKNRKPGKLTSTEAAVRRLVIESRNALSNSEIAEKIGVNYWSVLLARRKIEKIEPVPDFPDEEIADELLQSLLGIKELEEIVLREIRLNEAQAAQLPPNRHFSAMAAVRQKLVEQLRRVRQDRIDLLKAAGLLDLHSQRHTHAFRLRYSEIMGTESGVLAVPVPPEDWEAVYGGSQPDAPSR